MKSSMMGLLWAAALVGGCGTYDAWQSSRPMDSFNSSLNLDAFAACPDDQALVKATETLSELRPSDLATLEYAVAALSEIDAGLPQSDWVRATPEALPTGRRFHRVGNRHEPEHWLSSFDLVAILSVPITALMEVGRWFVLEDADSFFLSTNYDTYVMPKGAPGDAEHEIGAGTPFEIVVRFVAIDNFVEGRLRDSLGGNGAELSMQVSINALTDNARLMAEDRNFLLTEEARRRLPLLTLFQGDDETREWLTSFQAKVAAVKGDVDAYKARIGEWESSLDDFLTDGAPSTGWKEELATLAADTKRDLAADFSDQPEVGAIAGMLVDSVHDALAQAFGSMRADSFDRDFTRVLDDAIEGLESFGLALEYVEGSLGNLSFEDDEIRAKVEIIKGLANADRLVTMDYEGIRPRAMRGYGTAAIVFAGNPPSSGDDQAGALRSDFSLQEGVVFRGTLRDISDLGEAKGFSLSTLLIERDSDRISQAIRYIERLAQDDDVNASTAGLAKEASILAEAVSLLAEQIADDDVELKSLDVRFATGEFPAGVTAEKAVFRLQECDVLVTRNLEGSEFGAVALIEIRKTGDHVDATGSATDTVAVATAP